MVKCLGHKPQGACTLPGSFLSHLIFLVSSAQPLRTMSTEALPSFDSSVSALCNLNPVPGHFSYRHALSRKDAYSCLQCEYAFFVIFAVSLMGSSDLLARKPYTYTK